MCEWEREKIYFIIINSRISNNFFSYVSDILQLLLELTFKLLYRHDEEEEEEDDEEEDPGEDPQLESLSAAIRYEVVWNVHLLISYAYISICFASH